MTFHELAGGDDALASQVMENFKHNNFGNALLPLDLSGKSVDNAIDLGSADKKFRNVYAEQFYSKYGRAEFRVSLLSAGTRIGLHSVTSFNDDKTSDSYEILATTPKFDEISFNSTWNMKINQETILSNQTVILTDGLPLTTVDGSTPLDQVVRTTQPVVYNNSQSGNVPRETGGSNEKITLARFVKGNSLSQYSFGCMYIYDYFGNLRLQMNAFDTDHNDFYTITFNNFYQWGGLE